MIIYQAAQSCTGTVTAGLVQLRAHFMAQGHVLVDNGIYNCRPVRNSQYNTLSTHAEGRAWDGIFDTQASLDAAIDFLYEHREALQVQELISYNDAENRRWASNSDQTVNGGWREYTHAGAPSWAFHFARNWQGANDSRPIGEIVEVDMPLTDAEINKVVTATALHVVDALNKSLPALVAAAVEKRLDEERTWYEGDDGVRKPGALYGALRKFLRAQK